jgi:hypothetical protein
MNRRDFMAWGGGAALALGAGARTAAWSFATTGARPMPGAWSMRGARPFAAVCDRRFAASHQFGHAAARLGIEPWPIAGDVTQLWLKLRPQWERGEGAIVGMTSAVSFLCMQQLAAEFWMPVVARVEHVSRADAGVHHRMQLQEALVPQFEAALADEARWPAGLVVPLAHALVPSPWSRPVRAVTMTGHSSAPSSAMPLVSWAIAIRGAGRALASHGSTDAPEEIPS